MARGSLQAEWVARAKRVPVTASALFLILIPVAASSSTAGSSGTPDLDAPNVLIVIADDQPFRGSLARMEEVSGLEAVRFTEAYTNDPLCCPSRATMLTGLYDHHTGVTSNEVGDRFDDSSTLATWFDDAGYRTALFGKYLNEYPFDRSEGFVPPGWDQWQAFVFDAEYYDYELSENGTSVGYGSEPEDYSTDVLSTGLEGFISASPLPFFAVYSPVAPHGPTVPAPRHQGQFADEPVDLPRNFNRLGENPPHWMSRLKKKSADSVKQLIRAQWETLEAVDEAVGSAVDLLAERGELEQTVIVYVSDNGLALGSHRWLRKTCAFDECIHVPMLIAAPGVEARTEDALVSNVDLAPTVADLAGVPAPAVDGESLAPLMGSEVTSLRRPVLLHHVLRSSHLNAPTYWGIRSHRWKLVLYKEGGRELYNLRRDPWELRNLASKPRMGPRIRSLRQRIRELRSQ